MTANKTHSNKPITFTVAVGDIVTAVISTKTDHNGRGILVEIPGNPMGFVPASTLLGHTPEEKAARLDELVASPGTELELAVLETGTTERGGKETAVFKLSEAKARFLKKEAKQTNRQTERFNNLQAALDALSIGEVIEGVVVQKAVKTGEEGQYAFGVFVDIGEGLNGLVHVSELTGIQSQQRTRLNGLEEGDNITVKVLSKEMVAGKPRIRLSEKSAAVETLLSDHKPGSKVYGTVKKLISLGNKHGLFIDLNGVPGFLAEEDANVSKLESLTKNKNQRVHVTITDESIEGHVRVTRK